MLGSVRYAVFAFGLAGLLTAEANEIYVAAPTEFVFRGHDAYGEGSYEIVAKVQYEKSGTKLSQLRIVVGHVETDVDLTKLAPVPNPDFGSVRVLNDIGVFGSHFYIDIPFGDVGGCRKARKGKLKRVLTVSTDQNGSVERLRIEDPCDAT